MTGKVIFLTGGSGMVGRNILEHPRAAGLTILAPGRDELDLSDAQAVVRWIERHTPDVVIHTAGLVGGIQANMRQPVAFLDQNVAIGRNVIVGAYEAGVRKLLNLASTCMYPRASPSPLREEVILTGELEPTNEGYALAKIMSTRLCQYIRRETPEAYFKTLIPCNLYGRYDKFDPGASHLVPAIIQKIHTAKIESQDTVEIWGDGTARREFMFAGDLADAALRATQDIESLPDLMNVGVGSDHSINDYYRIVADVIGWRGDFVHDLSKPVGMRQKLCSIERQTDWGWRPTVPLPDGVACTYEFFSERTSP